MLIKFENCEVNLHKLKRGTLVDSPVGLTFITHIGSVDKINDNVVVKLYVENMGLEEIYYSDDLTWLNP